MTINEYIYIIFFGYVEPSKIEQTPRGDNQKSAKVRRV
jgi:hypothetical protein